MRRRGRVEVRDTHKELGCKAILQAFTESYDRARARKANPSEVVAYYVSQGPAGEEGGARQSVEYLDLESLRDFLFNQKKHNGILQQFVPSTGGHHSVIRVRWFKSRLEMEQRTNQLKLADRTKPIVDRLVTFDGSEHLSDWHAVMPSSRLASQLEMTAALVLRHIQILLPQRYAVHSATFFLKLISEASVQLLWCNSLTVQDREDGRLIPTDEARCATPVARTPVYSRICTLPPNFVRCPVCSSVVDAHSTSWVNFGIVHRYLKKMARSEPAKLSELLRQLRLTSWQQRLGREVAISDTELERMPDDEEGAADDGPLERAPTHDEEGKLLRECEEVMVLLLQVGNFAADEYARTGSTACIRSAAGRGAQLCFRCALELSDGAAASKPPRANARAGESALKSKRPAAATLRSPISVLRAADSQPSKPALARSASESACMRGLRRHPLGLRSSVPKELRMSASTASLPARPAHVSRPSKLPPLGESVDAVRSQAARDRAIASRVRGADGFLLAQRSQARAAPLARGCDPPPTRVHRQRNSSPVRRLCANRRRRPQSLTASCARWSTCSTCRRRSCKRCGA